MSLFHCSKVIVYHEFGFLISLLRHQKFLATPHELWRRVNEQHARCTYTAAYTLVTHYTGGKISVLNHDDAICVMLLATYINFHNTYLQVKK